MMLRTAGMMASEAVGMMGRNVVGSGTEGEDPDVPCQQRKKRGAPVVSHGDSGCDEVDEGERVRIRSVCLCGRGLVSAPSRSDGGPENNERRATP